ncbi:uncharacterized protein OCT59_028693 [Rhizophagus irregularis]|uniref:uncharacterized protein n=1 Tax=Rhizophagus irregularis TaxID=588596 RepID=UPI003324D6D3|nr:hypothetical protein OCT59_028693 [Rhizophagus irregularis]
MGWECGSIVCVDLLLGPFSFRLSGLPSPCLGLLFIRSPFRPFFFSSLRFIFSPSRSSLSFFTSSFHTNSILPVYNHMTMIRILKKSLKLPNIKYNRNTHTLSKVGGKYVKWGG